MLFRSDAHLDPEFVRPVRFALADALDLWRVQGIDLAAALAALLFQHAPGQEQRRSRMGRPPKTDYPPPYQIHEQFQ